MSIFCRAVLPYGPSFFTMIDCLNAADDMRKVCCDCYMRLMIFWVEGLGLYLQGHADADATLFFIVLQH